MKATRHFITELTNNQAKIEPSIACYKENIAYVILRILEPLAVFLSHPLSSRLTFVLLFLQFSPLIALSLFISLAISLSLCPPFSLPLPYYFPFSFFISPLKYTPLEIHSNEEKTSFNSCSANPMFHSLPSVHPSRREHNLFSTFTTILSLSHQNAKLQKIKRSAMTKKRAKPNKSLQTLNFP